MISVYSVVTSILFYNLSLLVLFFLRHRTKFLTRYAVSTLLFLTLLSVIRLFLPVDLEAAHIIRSDSFIPKLIEFISSKPGAFPLSVGGILLTVWAVGTVYEAARIISVETRAHKARKRYPCIRSEQVQRVSAMFDGDYEIKESPVVSQPYTVGLFRPVIYLPYFKLSDEELYFVLVHEIQHIKSHDNLKRLLFLIIQALFWWNPLAHLSVGEFEMLIEIQCDAKLASTMDDEMVDKYMQTLVTVMKRLCHREDGQTTKLATSFAQTYSIKQRFEVLLLRKDRKPRRMRYLLCLAMVVAFLLSYFVIIQPYYPPPDIHSDDDFVISEGTSYILIDNGTALLIYDGRIIDTLSEDNLRNAPYNEMPIIGG